MVEPTIITTPEGTPERVDAAKKRCELQGGVWDPVTRTCTIPERKPVGAGGSIKTPEQERAVGRIPGGVKQQLAQEAGVEPSGAARIAENEVAFQETQAIEAEKERIIAEETPQRRELDPATSTLEGVPVLGGTFGVVKDRFQDIVLATVPEGEYKEAFKGALGVATPEEMRSVALSQIEKEEIERGLTASESFGALVEGIPVVGSLAAKWAGGLIETPSENAKEVKSNILKEKRRISNIETNVKLGYLPVEVAREQLQDIENNVQRLESRIKLLINNSPELKFNSDYVNTVETEILATREKIFQGKQNILTGALTDPDELQLFLKLQQEDEDELV